MDLNPFKRLFKKVSFKSPNPNEIKLEQFSIAEIPVTIKLKESSRILLEAKLKEYRKRLNQHKPSDDEFIDAQYKIAVLTELLETGEINTAILFNKLGSFNLSDVKKFKNACVVIEGYNEGEVKNANGLMESPNN